MLSLKPLGESGHALVPVITVLKLKLLVPEALDETANESVTAVDAEGAKVWPP